MRCDNSLCIYEKEQHCLLENIDLDEFGCCRECIMVQWTDEELQEKKAKIHSRLTL